MWRAIAARPRRSATAGEAWRAALGEAGAAARWASRSAVGGGSLPEVTLPTFVLALPAGDADALAARLRRGDPPVIARIEDDRVVLDPRTVLPDEDEAVVRGGGASAAVGVGVEVVWGRSGRSGGSRGGVGVGSGSGSGRATLDERHSSPGRSRGPRD